MSNTMQDRPTLGIDIAKKTFQCALLQAGKYKHKSFSNDLKGYVGLSQWLDSQAAKQAHVCMEATGIYSEASAVYLVEAGFTVSVVNPAKIKGFAQCQLQRLKTDKADAKLIAQYCAAMKPLPWKPEPEHVRQLQALVRRLEDLSNTLNQEQNRLAVASPIVQPSLCTVINTINQEIKGVHQLIQAHIDQHPDLKQQAALLDSIPGIGKVTQAHVLAFIGNTARFETAKQCVAFVGLNPRPFTSGTSINAKMRISKTGSATLRKAFYMPALVAMKHNPILHTFAARLKQAGKRGKVLICAVMRKLVHIVYGVLKAHQPFNANVKMGT